MRRRFYIFALMATCAATQISAQPFTKAQLADTLTLYANKYANVLNVTVKRMGYIDNVFRIEANENLAYIPFRPENTAELKMVVQKMLEDEEAQVEIITDGKTIDELIPDAYLPANKRKGSYRLPTTTPLVRNLSLPVKINNGLQGKHIALWGSHGYHFDQNLNRWEWQRARLLQTVEDLYTSSYTMPFLVPMLENAGAIVLQPRERDTQLHEEIVDNENFDNQNRCVVYNRQYNWDISRSGGFQASKPFYTEGENPFKAGSYCYSKTTAPTDEPSYIEWIPDLPADGDYAVYVSYKTMPRSITDAHYTVYHAGGQTEFSVNQRMGGGTWVYLGTFHFRQGDPNKVVLTNVSKHDNGIVSADAVKFGGGMGNIARRAQTDSLGEYSISGYPRYMEGARYYLQWAGIPDSVYNYTAGMNDYTDDFSCRGRWANYLAGGSAANPQKPGLNIPLQLVLAFHSDAGTTLTDSIIGTLTIFTSRNNDKQPTFPTGITRYNSRDLADMVQTQIVEDIRATMAPEWSRRAIFNKSYSETRNPEMPSMILELLSHQNFADMRYGHDPLFKFTVCRAVYKAILRYVHLQYNTNYIIQPLPVHAFAISPAGKDSIKLSWRPTNDKLEPTAKATHYILYTKKDDGGFDNGIRVNAAEFIMPIEPATHYSFRVAAANNGGLSLPSETLSAYMAPESKGTALIINGFDRLCAPESFAFDSTYAGFIPNSYAIPYGYDVSYTGQQYEFRKFVPWSDDDAPGFGASYATYEQTLVAGNTFDYPLIHGKAIAAHGYSYVSASAATIDSTQLDSTYCFIDLILGKQKQTRQGTDMPTVRYKTFPERLQQAIAAYTRKGGHVLASGAYIGTDLWEDSLSTAIDRSFAQNILHYKHRSNHASQSGKARTVANPTKVLKNNQTYQYYTLPNPKRYPVESPDGIEPAGENSWTFMRYTDNNLSAAIAHDGPYKTCIFGFPIETIKDAEAINQLVGQVIAFFEQEYVAPPPAEESNTFKKGE